ncbi:MAG TPA: MFS transporter [Rubrobacter sp.]|nr:MFS transporter [Rubrobacter sp.]
MSNIGNPPCDVGVIQSGKADAPCSPRSGPWILAATIIGSAMAFIDSTVASVALPQIQERLGATAVDAQWIVESYALFLSALILVGGSLGDLFGRKRIFSLGVTIFTLASVWCGLSTSPEMLIMARAVQGVGGAMLVPGSLAIISASFEGERRGKAIGTWAGLSGVTTALGPILGGFLVDHISWRAAFFINVPLAVVVLLIVRRHVPESRDPDARKLDIPGAVFATLGLGGIVYGLITSAEAGFGDLRVLFSLVLGVGSIVAFVARERRTDDPMMPLSLFRSRNFSGANLLTLLLYAGLGGSLYYLPFLLIQVHGYSATAAGSSFLPFTIITFLMSRWAGGLITRYGARVPLVIGPLIAAAGFVLFAIPGTGGTYWTTFFPAIVVLGFGMSLVIAPLTTTAMNSVSGRHSGLASGVNNAVARTAGLLAIPVLGIFVFLVFSNGLDARVQILDLPPHAQKQLDSEKVNLGGAQAPSGVSGEEAAQIERAIDESFLAAFRLAMFIAAGMAVASAVAAAVIIEGKGSTAPTRRVGQTAPA